VSGLGSKPAFALGFESSHPKSHHLDVHGGQNDDSDDETIVLGQLQIGGRWDLCGMKIYDVSHALYTLSLELISECLEHLDVVADMGKLLMLPFTARFSFFFFFSFQVFTTGNI
jgi:hypothetical protein